MDILFDFLNIGFLKKNIFNICSSKPVNITKIVKLINKFYKKEKLVIYKKRRKGEMIKTFGDNRYLKKIIKKRKFMNIEKGIIKTINWYKDYKNKNNLLFHKF